MVRLHSERGVSVIIGTLLLILITVTAASALALMVSQMQKAEMNRQAQLQAVKDEDLVISGLSLNNNHALWDSPPYNISGSQNWSSVSFNLMNLNTQDSAVMGVAINNYYAYPLNFTSLSLSNPIGYCNLTVGGGCVNPSTGSFTSYLIIPAGKSVQVTMNLTGSLTDPTPPVFIGTLDQIDVKVLTSLTNIFEMTYRLPIPVIDYSTATTNLANNIQQDSIVLDGSQSSSENASIVSWNWSVMDANGTIPNAGNCADVNNLTLDSGMQPFYSSKIVHLSPPTDGPFCANLTVTDSNGMIATTAQDQLIPNDIQFNPAADLIATFNPALATINVTVLRVNGIPVSNADVSYVLDTNQFGTLTLSNYVGQTDSSGTNSTAVMFGNGTVKVISGQLSPVVVPVANTSL